MEPTKQGEAPKLSQVIHIDEGKIREHLGEVVRSTGEETLNAMLDAKRTVFAEPSGTNGRRHGKIRGQDPTSATYRRERGSHTKVPKLRTLPLRRRSPSATGGEKAPWKKHW